MDINYKKFCNITNLPDVIDNKFTETENAITRQFIRYNFNDTHFLYTPYMDCANTYIQNNAINALVKYYCIFKCTTIYQQLVDDVSKYIFMLSICK